MRAVGGALGLVLEEREVVPLDEVVAVLALALERQELEDTVVQPTVGRKIGDAERDVVDDRHRPSGGAPGRQRVIRVATSYLATDVRRPGVSSAGIAFRISSPRA